MNHESRIKIIIASAKTVPKRLAVLVDTHNEEMYLKALRAGLNESTFKIEGLPSPVKGQAEVRTIIVTRIIPHKPEGN